MASAAQSAEDDEPRGSSDDGEGDVDEGIEDTPSDQTSPPARSLAATAPSRVPISLKPLAQNWSVGAHSSEVFCVRFSSDSTLVAAGLGSGVVRVYQAQTGRLSYQLTTSDKGLPSTAMRFRPASASTKTRNVLLTANADGCIQHWHVTSGKCLHTIVEPDNQVFAIDYKADGSKFATAGKDYTVRIYDEATKTKVADLSSGFGKKHAGHSNRVFSLRFHPTDEHMLLSAGWDNTIQMWDLRTEGSVRSIFGPHICGDSVDISGNDIVSGSWRPTEQLQLWDYRSGELIANVPWLDSSEPCLLYAAQFSASGKHIAAGGSGANEVRLFSRSSLEPVGVVNLSKGVYGVDFSTDSRALAIAAGDLSVRVVAVPA
ncbi:hypothetical protein KFE25_006301 [Diacronema lutheri]|uniref:Anaphase-promoting complex subunit 4 WD40 domain-containing protein n=1 Tax=Diacronema lutheri TaxID=2081491 RepID=A0A8J5XVN1_DIALT|nr:hypothetical protein KFE25_006301 [Diacronema lutheri]